MRSLQRLVLLAALSAIVPALAGCEDFDMDKLDIFGISKKPPLPGKREDVFPGGVPGVTQGIPPEYMKGYQEKQQAAAPAQAGESGDQAQAGAAQDKGAAAAPAEKPKPKPAPKKRVVKRKPPPPAPAAPAAQQPAQAPWPATNQQPQQSNQAPWPDTAQPPQQQNAPWPASPPSGTFSR